MKGSEDCRLEVSMVEDDLLFELSGAKRSCSCLAERVNCELVVLLFVNWVESIGGSTKAAPGIGEESW